MGENAAQSGEVLGVYSYTIKRKLLGKCFDNVGVCSADGRDLAEDRKRTDRVIGEITILLSRDVTSKET